MTTPRAPLLKQVETLNYRPGGFHPVHLGDHFKKDRYNVIHKLGHGGFATVWLARDSTRNRYVALKILAARLSRDCPEVEILRRIKLAPEHNGKPYVMSMLDHFWINGPNGRHLCVVSQVGGPSIKQFNECPGQSSGTRRLRALVARKVALQATEGLDYIHSTGVVHGDFTSANILLQLANIDQWTEKEIYERLGKTETQDFHHASSPPISESTGEPSAPRYTINAINMKTVDPRFLSDQIIIIDFGIAFLQEQSSADIGTPKPYCAPEFLFEGVRSVSSDIWALGCTIFEIRTGTRLFRYKGKPSRNQILIAMVKGLGSLPEEWWGEWEEGLKWYAKELLAGGELVDNIRGSLYTQIMDIGMHDGDYPTPLLKGESIDHEKSSQELGDEPTDSPRGSTSRMVGMVGDLTTSEAEDVMRRVNKLSSTTQEEEYQADSKSSAKVGSGSGSGPGNKTTSGSSNAKSGDKSISSEGLSTGVKEKDSNVKPGSGENNDNLNVIGKESLGEAGSVENATQTAVVRDFLEPEGTRVTTDEADGLENLLRSALTFSPEERLPPSELAKHHWFSEDYQ